MGSNKALLQWQGMRLVDYVASMLTTAGIEEVYVSGSVEGYPSIPDTVPHQGPVGGICSSVERLAFSHRQLIAVPVDMPLLSAECLRLLLFAGSQEDATYFEEHPLPCHLTLSPKVIAYSKQMSLRDACSVKEYLHGLNACSLKILEKHRTCLTNTNTPQQWKEATYEAAYQ